MKKGPHLLVILDGFGYQESTTYNAIYQAHPKNFQTWMDTYPTSLLHASGTFVGLLPHMIGNSEVGHLTLGAGRVVKQPLLELHEKIASGELCKDKLLKEHFALLKKHKKRLHLIGLLSDAGVHSHIDHLLALIRMAQQEEVPSLIVHPFLDGRDTPPKSAGQYLELLEDTLSKVPQGIIGSMHGRFYAMDRDHHWERTERSYKLLTTPQKPLFSTWQEALYHSYDFGITDEFFIPLSLHEEASFQEGDLVIFFNFRADRARQLTQALLKPETVPALKPSRVRPSMITCTSYHPDFNVPILIHKHTVYNTFLDVVEQAGMRIFTIAETEKYAHVTYFFNGGRETIRPHETRILIPSKRHFATYASLPQMSAPEITATVLTALHKRAHDFYLINYANADMVGHSGDFEATCKAIEWLDKELGRLYHEVIEVQNGTLYVTADHGKAEDMWDLISGQPRTAHTTHKVPFIVLQKSFSYPLTPLPQELAQVAPFLLGQLELPIPREMKKLF